MNEDDHDQVTEFVVRHCPTCKEPIEYEQWGQGYAKFHKATGKFQCKDEV